ncbi:MAG TPA: methyltransferase domain-containing protein [Nitrososphaerales archaeon]|nr:methyltransferase domain-containing protein [Nitrososphaerales archaeon]
MDLNPIERFTVRADDYAKYRPGYPPGIIGILEREVGFSRNQTVADIGSGTGLLTKLFLENGNRVFGVEPNSGMRHHAESSLSGFRRFVSVKGTAEHTTLRERSVDLVTMGQALHWFDPDGTAAELARISKPGGSLCIAYNETRRGSEVMRAFRNVTVRNEGRRRNEPNVGLRYSRRFFKGGRISRFVLPNEQTLDFEGLLGRLLSGSHMPTRNEPTRLRKLERDVRRLFDSFQEEGRIRLLYDTRLFVGRIGRPAK